MAGVGGSSRFTTTECIDRAICALYGTAAEHVEFGQFNWPRKVVQGKWHAVGLLDIARRVAGFWPCPSTESRGCAERNTQVVLLCALLLLPDPPRGSTAHVNHLGFPPAPLLRRKKNIMRHTRSGTCALLVSNLQSSYAAPLRRSSPYADPPVVAHWTCLH
eukprot:352932-Chlamydomonas_euryale.AAC.12